MPLAAGTRLGAYEILSLLGAGGMGEVYRATDTVLKRQVALKVLPPEVAGNPERIARFQREAEVLASLNHPNIAHLYGIEKSNGTIALVMELVEGPTLADRITKGPIPLDEAMPIAKQIAEALEAAHEQAIIHRDLKPANVKVRDDGTVKVLDFGLAKAMEPTASATAPSSIAPTHSPAITSPALMTGVGVLLGTAAYMSPEQARGRPADKRSDIWAFGCVLYEMLTGRRAFDGTDVTETLAAIIKTEPEWACLPLGTPRSVHTVLHRSLQKDRGRRLDSAADARLELEDAEIPDAPPLPGLHVSPVWRWMALASGAVAIATLVAAAGAIRRDASSADAIPVVVRFTMTLPPALGFRSVQGGGATIAVSPDGKTIVYTTGGQGELIARRMDSESFEQLEWRGTGPFFSPDSQWVAFFSEGKLLKAPRAGGLAMTICEAPAGRRGTWGSDGTIVFADPEGLYRVSSSGGIPEPLGPGDLLRGVQGSAQPSFIPNAHAVLVAARDAVTRERRVGVLTLDDGQLHDLTAGATPLYSPTGHVLFTNQGQLWAAVLDQSRWRLATAPVPVLGGFRIQGETSMIGLASDGTLAYVSGELQSKFTVVWLNRSGEVVPALTEAAAFGEPRLSADGIHLAITVSRNDGADIWVYDLQRGARIRLTPSGDNRRPVWSPDGQRVAFQTQGSGILARTADASRGIEALVPVPASRDVVFPDAWAPDGTIVYNQGANTRDLWSLLPGAQPERLTATSPHSERSASVSPDGRWLLYVSNESGRDEVYVQPFRRPGARTVVSTHGGKQPRWSRDGREIYYRLDDSMMAVPFAGGPSRIGVPATLFEFPRTLYGDDPNRVEYDVAADGRFIAVRAAGDMSGDEIKVVVNWASLLAAKAQ